MKNKSKTMKNQFVSLDRISTLPDNITEKILTLMPIRDALRTSILSKKWRYSWRSMPKLAFSEGMVRLPPHDGFTELKKYKFVNAIFHVLLFHNGPTKLELFYYFDNLEMVSEVDQIMSYLSRGSSVKELIFELYTSFYRLPVSFFSLEGLETIHLQNCVLEPPLTFHGFSRLRKIVFNHVKISAQMLQRFFSKCPLLEYIGLEGDNEDIHFVTGGNNFTFVDLLQCVPLVKGLDVTEDYVKCMSAGGMPHKLPTTLAYLKYLCLDVCLMYHNDMSSALCIIRSSPVLEKIIIAMYGNEKLVVQETPTNFFDPDDCADLKLDHLKTFKIEWFSNLPVEMEFVRLIMAKSPVLKKVQLELSNCVSGDEELEMLRNLVRNPFPRASPSAQLIIERP